MSLHQTLGHSGGNLDGPWQRHLQVASRACDEAQVILRQHFGHLHKVEEKFQAGLVSEADRGSEERIRQLISQEFPDHDILGEEFGLSSGDTSKRESLWMIDPLDGTTNYVHRFPCFCISIGFQYQGELVMGVVDAPMLGLRFHAVKGQGAFANGERISVSSRKALRDGLFVTGFSGQDPELDAQLALVKNLVIHSRGVRRVGAAALDLCFVAQGVFDGFWERGLAPWDTAAGAVIVREAGGLVSDFDNCPFHPKSPAIVAGSPDLQPEIIRRYSEILRR